MYELSFTFKASISSEINSNKDALNKIIEMIEKEFPSSSSIFNLDG